MISSGLTQLNSSLNNIDIRYTSANGAQWSERGADTWHPFSGAIKGLIMLSNATNNQPPQTYLITDEDGTILSGQTQSMADLLAKMATASFIQSVSNVGGTNYHFSVTVAKDGYYVFSPQTSTTVIPAFYSAGTTITSALYPANGESATMLYLCTQLPN